MRHQLIAEIKALMKKAEDADEIGIAGCLAALGTAACLDSEKDMVIYLQPFVEKMHKKFNSKNYS